MSAAGRLVVEASAEAAVEERRDLALLRRLAPYMRPHLLLFGAAVVLMPVAAFSGLFQPWLVKRAIDATLLRGDQSELLTVVAWFGVAIAFEFVARFTQTYLMQLAGQRSTADLRSAVFRHIQRLPVGYFDKTPVGRVVTRVTNDIDAITELFASGAVTALTDLITLVGIVGFMLAIDWQLSLVAFSALPPLAIAVNVFRRWARAAFRAIRLRIAQLNAYLAEQVAGVRVVQAYGREDDCADEYGEINRAYRDANYQSIRYDALLYSVVQSVSAACVALVLYFAAVRIGWLEEGVSSAVYVGTVIAFYDYIERFFVPIRDLATKYTIIQSSLASAERVFTLLDTETMDVPDRTEEAEPDTLGESAISFENVSFAYREGHPVLHEINLDVKRGQRIAVVGATGSGKSTLLSLLLRLYETREGVIRVMGRDVRSMDRHTLRRMFGVVPQDVFLFAGTLRENLSVGDPNPNDEAMQEALVQVGCWERLEGRGGLDARVEERGQNFSAGERQLLAFARALYRDADLLLLDEATANVDSETEAQLQKAADRVLRGRTSLIIAHRLSTIESADRIIVVHRGRIAEQGTHLELLGQGGIYARLHRLQSE